MATKMGWFDVPLGAEVRQLVASPEQAVDWINTNFGKPLKYYNSAADMRMIWKSILTNGIIPEIRTAKETTIIPETQLGNSFSTTMLYGLRVQINPGLGFIDGAYCYIDEPIELSMVAGATNDIVLHLDTSGSDVIFDVRVKTRSTATIQEGLVRAGGVYELGLHTVTVPAGESVVTSGMIKDHRLNVELGSDGKPCCGICGSLLQPDISALYDRARKALQEVLDAATPPDGNLASGIYLTDSDNHYTGNTVEEALQETAQKFEGIVYQIHDAPYVIKASGWVENAEEMRKEYKLEHEKIKASNFSKIVLPNELAGKINLSVEPRPHDGYVTLYTTDTAPKENIEVQLIIREVRTLE